MKRTGLRRTSPMKKCRLNDKGVPRERFEGLRLEDFRAWIRERSCLLAGSSVVAGPGEHTCWSPEGKHIRDAAHVESKARGAGDAGNLVPLCRRAHQELHTYGTRSFERAHGLNLREIAGALWLEYEREKGVGL